MATVISSAVKCQKFRKFKHPPKHNIVSANISNRYISEKKITGETFSIPIPYPHSRDILITLNSPDYESFQFEFHAKKND